MTATRYEIVGKLASGGMAQVYVGRVRGALGFEQLVALKRPHPHLLEQKSFRDMFVKEAYVSALIRHANVVAVRDVELDGASVTMVMEYIDGVSLAELLAVGDAGPTPAIFLRVVLDAASGLHAAHEAKDREGRPLGLVHRDVSPQNVLVGVDGVSRVSDFGIAKCVAHTGMASTGDMLKGKLGYMAPEYLQGKGVDRRADVFALGVVLWEGLASKQLFAAANEAEALMRLLYYVPPPVSSERVALGTAFDAIVARALAKSPDDRFPTMEALADALYAAARPVGLAAHGEVAQLVRSSFGESLDARRAGLTPRDGKAIGEMPTLAAPSPSARMAAAKPTLVYAQEASSKTGAPVTAQQVAPRQAPPRSRRGAIAVVAALVVAGGAAAVVVPRMKRREAPATTDVPSTPLAAPVAPPPLAASAAEPASSGGAAVPPTTATAAEPSASTPAHASGPPRTRPPRGTPPPLPPSAATTPPPVAPPTPPPATTPEPRPNPYKTDG